MKYEELVAFEPQPEITEKELTNINGFDLSGHHWLSAPPGGITIHLPILVDEEGMSLACTPLSKLDGRHERRGL